MSNKNYAQVTDLLAQGQLKWVSDSILALLCKNVAYNANHKRLSDISGKTVVSQAPIQGRWLGKGGMAMGLPAAFGSALSEQEYQVLVAKDDGRYDPLLLSFMDQDDQGEPLGVLRTGTLIVRPYHNVEVQPLINPPLPAAPPTVGVWMVLA